MHISTLTLACIFCWTHTIQTQTNPKSVHNPRNNSRSHQSSSWSKDNDNGDGDSVAGSDPEVHGGRVGSDGAQHPLGNPTNGLNAALIGSTSLTASAASAGSSSATNIRPGGEADIVALMERETYIRLSEPMTNLTRPVGAKGTFYCDILGEPIPQFEWFRNNEKLTEKTGKIRITNALWGSSLRVEKLQQSDAGTYLCVATNPSGTLNATAYLQVTTKAKTTPAMKPQLQDEQYLSHPVAESDGFCQEFHSNVCGNYLGGHRVYVTREFQQAMIEAQISKFLKLTATQSLYHVREDCLRRLMEAICYYNFPVCLPINSGSFGDDPQGVGDAGVNQVYQTRYLCRQDCEMVMENECGQTYEYLERKMMRELPSMIMHCSRLPVYTTENPQICRRIGEPLLVSDQSQIIRHNGERVYWDDNQPLTGVDPTKKGKSSNLPSPKSSGELTTSISTTPDLLPIFVSIGVLALLGAVLLVVCFLCRRNNDGSPRLQADGSSLLGRSRFSGSCHGRQTRLQSERLNGFQTRGQGVGAPNDSSINKKRRVPGMGAGAKVASSNGPLNGTSDGYGINYSTGMITSSSVETNVLGTLALTNGQNSISSAPHNPVSIGNDMSLQGPNSVSNNIPSTYYQYQASNFMTTPMPPPNAPAPPPPPPLTATQIMLSQCISNQPLNSTTSAHPPSTLSAMTVAYNIQPFNQTVHVSRNSEILQDPTTHYEASADAESPTAYTTLRNTSPNGYACSDSQNSGNSVIGAQNPSAFLKGAGDEIPIKAAEYPISQLRFGKQFGQGVFGPVYKAELLPSNAYENGIPTSVIVKTLSAGLPASLQANFRREANLISELDHPNVLSLLGVSLQHPPWCMIFEIRQYLDLCELLSSRRSIVNQINLTNVNHHNGMAKSPPTPLSEAEMWHILGQIAAGMEYLSSHRFVHRDLAARNVLIVNDQLICKITDLGLARDCYASDYYRLHPHSLMLPIRWMPLDSIIYGKFTVESDIWAFGVLMWEVWSGGMRPYGAFTDSEVLDLIRSRQLLACPQHCPTHVYMFMTSCWNEEIERRPTFRDCVNQIEQWHCDSTMEQSLPYPQRDNGELIFSQNHNEPLREVPVDNHLFSDPVTTNDNSLNLLNQGHRQNSQTHYSVTENDTKLKFSNTDPFEMSLQVNPKATDGLTGNDKMNSMHHMFQYNPSPLSSKPPPIQDHRIDPGTQNNLGIRLLPNTNTMYIPTINPVI